MKFRLVDRITSWEARKRIAGTKTVSFEEYGMCKTLGREACLPESLVLESFFQLGNWLIMLSTDFTMMGLVIRTGRIEFDSQLLPGERMDMVLSARSFRDDGVLFDGQGRAGSRLIASGTACLALPVPLEGYCDPEFVRVLFEGIYRPEDELRAE